MKVSKYYVQYAPAHNSYSVFERGKLNEFGEAFCIVPLVSYEEAVECKDNLDKYDEAYPSKETKMQTEKYIKPTLGRGHMKFNWENINFFMNQFMYHKDTQVLSAEASGLRLAPGFWPDHITITNPETGKAVLFERYSSRNTIDGDLGIMIYKAISSTVPMLEVHIFND